MFIQTEITPNPASLKFLPGRSVLGEGTLDVRSSEDADLSPLAQRIFDVRGVSGVLLGSDFVTVTKSESEWPQLKPAVLGAIMEHFMSGAPVLSEGVKPDTSDLDEFYDEKDAEIVSTIKDLLDARVRPAVANDGGDITFRGFKDGIVFLNMKGSCSGCPSSTATLKNGIENLLKHFVPEVAEVQAV